VKVSRDAISGLSTETEATCSAGALPAFLFCLNCAGLTEPPSGQPGCFPFDVEGRDEAETSRVAIVLDCWQCAPRYQGDTDAMRDRRG
jgi:hypothetical protein